MKIEQTYLVGKHHYAFRSGEPALITGVRTIQPDYSHPARVCYEILFPDGVIDYVPVSEVENENHVFCTKNEYNNGINSD